MSQELSSLSLVETAKAIATKQLSALEVTQACVARAERLQDKLNCFISLDRAGSEDQARRADRLAAEGKATGPLHGVPVAHKDMFYRRGRAVTCGSRLRQGFFPGFTATALDRLDSAGAIDLGGLNMSEFACNPFGFNVLVGPARNPWNPEYIAGGSSSGSAVAVAAGIVFGSLGSDTGGSVRFPAAICGVPGLKPTDGRISRHGMMKLSFSLDNAGVIARSVQDLARLLRAVAGHDTLDPTSAMAPVFDYEAALDSPVAGCRLGIPRNYFREGIADDIRQRIDGSLEVFQSMGVELVDVDVPDPSAMEALATTIILSEAATIHAQWLAQRGDDYTPVVRERISFGFSFTAPKYVEALSLRGRILAETLATAFAGVDALHTPMTLAAVPRIADIESSLRIKSDLSFDIGHCTRPINYLGLPALSVPCGVSDDGLPVAFQLVGRPFAEHLLLNLGHAYEKEAGHTKLLPI